MKTSIKTAEAIVGKTVEFTTQEMEQMAKVCDRVVEVLESHKTQDGKKQYLTDDDLYRLEAILMCILETESYIGTTCFDKYEKNARKQREIMDYNIDKPRRVQTALECVVH